MSVFGRGRIFESTYINAVKILESNEHHRSLPNAERKTKQTSSPAWKKFGLRDGERARAFVRRERREREREREKDTAGGVHQRALHVHAIQSTA